MSGFAGKERICDIKHDKYTGKDVNAIWASDAAFESQSLCFKIIWNILESCP